MLSFTGIAMVGRTVAQYQLIEKLGAGGMGEIYRAQDTRLSRVVAIKVLPESYVGDPERRRRFLQEGRAASALNHPNIITIHDVLFEGDTAFLVMEFVSGQTLAELIAAGPMVVPDVLKYATQMADALAAAHDAGIVHRDLKPGNVMVTPRGLVKILDFGLAKRSAFSASTDCDATTTVGVTPLTVEGSILGTVHYMSPEQAEGRLVDSRSDIFSFGVMLYEMLTGTRPFAGDTTLSVLSSILREDAKPVSASSPSVSRPIDELVGRCIAKKPDARWQSMHELHDTLALLKGDSEAPRTSIAPPAPAARRSPLLLGIGAGAAVLLVLGAGWWTLGHRKVRPVPVVTVAVPAAADVPSPAPVPAPAPAAPAPNADVLTNDGVIAMLAGKVPGETILQQIRASQTRFDLSVPEVIRLTNSGASPELIETMRNPKRRAAAAEKGVGEKPAAPVRPVPPPSAVAAAAAVTVVVPDALPISIELAEDVPSDAEPGREIHFTLSKELRIGQAVVAAAHAPVTGEIVDGAKKKLIGGTKLTFRLKSVAAAGGNLLLVRAAASGADGRRPVESKSMPKPPKGVAAVIGTEYVAYTAGEQVVSVGK
jgi:serine/threonine-protein kinase